MRMYTVGRMYGRNGKGIFVFIKRLFKQPYNKREIMHAKSAHQSYSHFLICSDTPENVISTVLLLSFFFLKLFNTNTYTHIYTHTLTYIHINIHTHTHTNK